MLNDKDKLILDIKIAEVTEKVRQVKTVNLMILKDAVEEELKRRGV